MAIQAPVRLSVADYLAWEENNFEKHEYIDGELRCMAGATAKHNRIMTNLTGALWRQLDNSDCFLLSSEMRVKAGESRYVYPDLSAVCGEEQFERANEMELLNPILVIEVTSPSTIAIDRGEKKDFYLQVPSIQDYLIIDQHRVQAEHCARSGGGGWRSMLYNDVGAAFRLGGLGCRLALAEVYRGISFDAPPR